MTTINEQADEIVRGLKELAPLQNVRFVREFSAAAVETPVSGFLAVVGVKSAERSRQFLGGDATSTLKGEMYAAVVELRVYSPYGGNGSGLSEVVGAMLTGLRTVDTAGIISDASASSIEFDAELNTIFRRLSFRLEFCLCEEEANE
ncbi:MAG: hypothetical protein IJ598_10285 [Ruminococcus sp.]|nr:hypothetical protein [Ruminococcus sp.]